MDDEEITKVVNCHADEIIRDICCQYMNKLENILKGDFDEEKLISIINIYQQTVFNIMQNMSYHLMMNYVVQDSWPEFLSGLEKNYRFSINLLKKRLKQTEKERSVQ